MTYLFDLLFVILSDTIGAVLTALFSAPITVLTEWLISLFTGA